MDALAQGRFNEVSRPSDNEDFADVSLEMVTLAGKLDDALKASPRVQIYGGAGNTGQVFITPRTRRIIELASEEASRLKDEFISTEHLLLAIASERNTPTARILADAKITRGDDFSGKSYISMRRKWTHQC